MQTIAQIEEAVRGLSPADLDTFRTWFAEFDGTSGESKARRGPIGWLRGRSWLFWAALVMGGPLSYMLSYPWVCAVAVRNPALEPALKGPLSAIYQPFGFAFSYFPESVQHAYVA